MTENFVLVHGAWHGGWAWQPVASRLRSKSLRGLSGCWPIFGTRHGLKLTRHENDGRE